MADVKICDRCGKKLNQRQTFLNIKPVRYVLGEEVFNVCLGWMGRISNSSFDLCDDCTVKLNEFLTGGDVEATEK